MPQEKVRVQIRVPESLYERLQHWANKRAMSVSEYVNIAIEESLVREMGDYDIPALEVQRLNELRDEIKSLSVNVQNLEHIVMTGMDSLLALTRGDNYLLDDEV